MKKNVIVTGGSKGLGLEIVRKVHEQNFFPIIISRSAPDVAFEHAFYQYDLTQTDGISELTKKIKTERGSVYGLVNNAAIGLDGVLSTMHESDIERMLKINVQAPILLAKYISRQMMVSGGGRIVNVSSIIANTGFNGLSVYAASKASLIGFTKSLARELGKVNINVNSVLPGYMTTEMTSGLPDDKLESIKRRSPNGKFASVEDVASMVCYLLKPESASINGASIVVDNGSTA